MRSLRVSLSTDFQEFIRELAWTWESRTCVGFIRGVSPVSPTRPESRVREQLSRRLVRTSTSDRRVALSGEIPGSTRGSVRDQRSKVVEMLDVCRGVSARREFSRSSTVSKRVFRSPSSVLRNTHTLSLIPRCYVHGTPASEDVVEKCDAESRRYSHIHIHVHADTHIILDTDTPESCVVIISSPAIAWWEKRTTADLGEQESGEEEPVVLSRNSLGEPVCIVGACCE